MHKMGSLQRLPHEYGLGAFKDVFGTADTSAFRCAFLPAERQRDRVVFVGKEPGALVPREYTLTKWHSWAVSRSIPTLHKLLVKQPELLNRDLDSIPEKHFHGFPARNDDGSLSYLGQVYWPRAHVGGRRENLGWITAILDEALAATELNPHVFVGLKLRERFTGSADQSTQPGPSSKPLDDGAREGSLASAQGIDPNIPTVLGSLLLFHSLQVEGKPGSFYVCDVLSTGVLLMYVLEERCRQAHRRLVWTSDMAWTYSSTLLKHSSLRQAPWAAGELLPNVEVDESMEITRPCSPEARAGFSAAALDRHGAGQDTYELYCPAHHLDGLVPGCLLAEYQFWQVGPCAYRGYPRSLTSETQLLIELTKQVSVLTPDGMVLSVPLEHGDTGSMLLAKVSKHPALLSASKTLSECRVATGHVLALDQAVDDAEANWTARIKRVPCQSAESVMRGEPPPPKREHSDLVLLNSLRAAPASRFGKLVRHLMRIEHLSDLLIWTRSEVVADGEECELSVVELRRLNLSFTASSKGGGPARLYSVEHDGLHLHTEEVDEIFENYAGDIPHAVLLKNGHSESFLLIPNYGLKRAQAADELFPSKVYLGRDAGWLERATTRFFIYPVHVSGAMLVTSNSSELLYLIVMHLTCMEYQRCGQLMTSLSIDGKLSAEEQWFLKQVDETTSDEHPDAVGLRLRLALMCRSSGNEPPFNYAQDYMMYCAKYVTWRQSRIACARLVFNSCSTLLSIRSTHALYTC